MHNSIFALLLFFCFFSFDQEKQDEFLWQCDNRLNWVNFKGKPDLTSKHRAISVCRIKMDYHSKKDTLFVDVRAVLVQSKSWVEPKSKIKSVLSHEQIHFDIAEIYARKLRQSILVLKTDKSTAVEKLTLLDEWNDEHLKDYQILYDKETNHSQIKSKQIEWEKKIAAELKALETYSNTKIRLLLQK